jgi:hypothetical protein
MTPPVYIDPASPEWPHPNLIAELMSKPATEALHPLEAQSTIVLAWLLDRSEVFARRIAQFLVEGDSEAEAAVAAAATTGARSWVTLPPVGPTGSLYPDLSIAGDNRSFELIVEIKVGAALHYWELPDGARLVQPDAYLRSWRENCSPGSEARVRRVGTLTVAGPGVALAADAWRARDVTWSEVYTMLDHLLEGGDLERHVVPVAIDARSAITSKILGTPKAAPIDDPLLERGYELIASVLDRFQAEGHKTSGPRVPSDYVGGYVTIDSIEGPLRFWLYVTGGGGQYAPVGAADSVWIAENPDNKFGAGIRARLEPLGFAGVKDRAGYTLLRTALPIDRARGETVRADTVVRALTDALSHGGLVGAYA